MAIAAALLVFLFVLPASYAVDYTVGDTAGWNQGVDYTTWVSGKTFNVGDKLIFNYGSSHTLDVVNKADYDNCASSNVISSHTDGATTITLDKAGTMYFLCPVIGHCSGGMKLAVPVAAAGTPGGPTPTPSTPTTPSNGTPSSRNPSRNTPAGSGATSNLYNLKFVVLGAFTIFAFMV